MPPTSTFLRTIRLLWVGVNVAILIVTVSGYRDLSGLIIMLSFPADVVGGILLMAVIEGAGWREPLWLINSSYMLAATACGYLQWFVIGRALAKQLFAWFPSRRLLNAVRIGGVVMFSGLTFLGLAMVGAQAEAEHYGDRAVTVREGMTIDEVRSILGDPRSDEAASSDSASLCPTGTARVRSYWYEHEWLPRRLSGDSLFWPVCFDREGKVTAVGMGRGH